MKAKKRNRLLVLRRKLVFVFLVIFLGLIGVAIRLYWVAILDEADYEKKALSQETYKSSVIPYKRGSILDRRGIILAHSVPVYKLILEPKNVNRKPYFRRATLEALSSYFKLSLDELNEKMDENPDSYYVPIKKEISSEEKKEFEGIIKEYNQRDTREEAKETRLDRISGITFEKYYRREYPKEKLASDMLGYTNSGNDGSWGLEEFYNEYLNGKDGRKYAYFNSENEVTETVLSAKNGYHLKTSIDSEAQKITENIIDEFMTKEGAKNVGVLVMNPNNGDVYVMASDRQFNPNNPRDLSAYYKEDELSAMGESEKLNALDKIWRNFCLSDVYEPGSTFKPFTVAACLEQKVCGKDEKFSCDGFEVVADHRIHCVKREGHGSISLSGSLEQSCNDVMMQLVFKLGRGQFARYQRIFGIGTKTGIDLPGEATGIVYNEKGLNPVELATSSFGQGVSVTMLQIAAGISSVINGGVYYKPRIVKEIVNEAGMVVEERDVVVMRKTVTKETSDFIKEALFQTVEHGSGFRAKASGYKVAGKTGTAQKFDEIEGVGKVRSEKNYVLSFVGFAPYDHPEALVYVIVDEPKVEEQARSGQASALAGKIISEVFPVLGIYPEKTAVIKKEE